MRSRPLALQGSCPERAIGCNECLRYTRASNLQVTALIRPKLPALLLPLALALAIPHLARAASVPPQNAHQESAAKTMKSYQKHQKQQMKKAAKQQKAAQNKWRKQHNVGH